MTEPTPIERAARVIERFGTHQCALVIAPDLWDATWELRFVAVLGGGECIRCEYAERGTIYVMAKHDARELPSADELLERFRAFNALASRDETREGGR